MKYVVTGATSFIGLELLSLQHQVVAVCRPNSQGLSKIPAGVEIVTEEMSDYGNLHREIERADVFVNLAWGGTGHDGRNVQDVQRENVINTIAAMFAADKMGCQVFVEAGSQADYGTVLESITEETPCHPFSEYGKAKLEVKERLFELSEQLGIKYIHLRIFSLFGENDHPWTLVMSSIDKMLRNEPEIKDIPVLFLTGIGTKDAVERVMTLKPDGYILKSTTREDLLGYLDKKLY